MALFEHRERLIHALDLINSHRADIVTFYRTILGLQVRSEGVSKLKEAFRASVSERRGASFHRGEVAVTAFDRIIETLADEIDVLVESNPQEAHKKLFDVTACLPNIDQKIAAMFIKFLCVYLNVWPSMTPYLFVPIDRVVLKILKGKLKVYTGSWTQSPSVKNPQGRLYVRGNAMSAQYAAFMGFQNELGEIASAANTERIMVDELWFIGTMFCKEYPLCEKCWVREACHGSPFN